MTRTRVTDRFNNKQQYYRWAASVSVNKTQPELIINNNKPVHHFYSKPRTNNRFKLQLNLIVCEIKRRGFD